MIPGRILSIQDFKSFSLFFLWFRRYFRRRDRRWNAKLFYLPEPHTDFILSIIAEESGFIGVLIVIFLFAVLIVRGFMISFKAPDLFSTLLAAGLTMVIALEAFINIAGVMGLIPLKGLALPFVSYGGTSLIMSLWWWAYS